MKGHPIYNKCLIRILFLQLTQLKAEQLESKTYMSCKIKTLMKDQEKHIKNLEDKISELNKEVSSLKGPKKRKKLKGKENIKLEFADIFGEPDRIKSTKKLKSNEE